MNIEFLRQVQNLPSDAVFGVISDLYKECYISHTTNLKTRIGAIIENIELREDSRLVVFYDTIQDDKYKRIFSQYCVDMYSKLGYKILGSGREYINYKVKVWYSGSLQEVYVMLVNKRKDKEIVGVFKSVDEANSFVEQYYRGELVQPVYAVNRETVGYINRKRNSKPKN